MKDDPILKTVLVVLHYAHKSMLNVKVLVVHEQPKLPVIRRQILFVPNQVHPADSLEHSPIPPFNDLSDEEEQVQSHDHETVDDLQ